MATGALAALALLVAVAFKDPAQGGFFPACPSKALTGWDCPGCGSLRSLHQLMHGHWAAAWALNPALIVGLALVAVLLVANIPCHPRFMRRLPPRAQRLLSALRRKTVHPLVPWLVFVAIVAWTIYRNIK